tara:strand:- start:5477 stop:5806 length:330 start_codon:yes stop_codon:yes gene_type:complete
MRTNRLDKVVKIGYIEPPTNGARVRPELPPINADITNYGEERNAFRDFIPVLKEEYARNKRIRENETPFFHNFGKGFYRGIMDTFGWLVKGIVFICVFYLIWQLFSKIF